MAKPSITSAQSKAIADGFLDLVGENKSLTTPVAFSTIADSLAYVAAVYTDKLNAQLVAKEADSSGALAKSIVASDVVLFGSVYHVDISAEEYASFIDEGVDGWANSRGSRFKFKTKGVNTDGDMVKSVKAYLLREAKIGSIKNRPVSAKESKRQNITDASTKAAITAAYMIKRFGIKPNHFWRDATTEMDEVILREFSAALQVDIIQNLTQ